MWIPRWLSAVADAQEIVEWKAIRQARRGRDCHERMLEFIQGMRKKYPRMPFAPEEEMERGVQRLKANPWLRWRQGLHDDPVVDKITTQLSHEERYHLSRAILAFNDAEPDAILAGSLADLPSEQRAVIMKVRRLSREYEHGGE